MVENKYYLEVMHKMFSMVGRTYSPEAVDQPGWYSKSEWTEDVQEEFRTWLYNYFMKSRGAREFFLEYPNKDKRRCMGASKEFVCFHGWKVSP